MLIKYYEKVLKCYDTNIFQYFIFSSSFNLYSSIDDNGILLYG